MDTVGHTVTKGVLGEGRLGGSEGPTGQQVQEMGSSIVL